MINYKLKLFLLLFIALLLLPKSQDRNGKTFPGWGASIFGFDNCMGLFLPDTLSSILLSIMHVGYSHKDQILALFAFKYFLLSYSEYA